MGKNVNFHRYDDRVMLNNLSNKNETDLKIDFKKNQFIIQGFLWELGCLFDNMFLKKDECNCFHKQKLLSRNTK